MVHLTQRWEHTQMVEPQILPMQPQLEQGTGFLQ